MSDRSIYGDHKVQIRDHSCGMEEYIFKRSGANDSINRIGNLTLESRNCLDPNPYCKLTISVPSTFATLSNAANEMDRFLSPRCLGFPCQAIPTLNRRAVPKCSFIFEANPTGTRK